jgi:hypothetical protein
VWDDFCRDFGFNLCDIAGNTDEVFANFRGLVLSTSGVETAQSSAEAAAKSPQDTSPFNLRCGGHNGFSCGALEVTGSHR